MTDTKNIKFKPLLSSLIIGVFSIYHAWSIYSGQVQNHRRIDKLVNQLYGSNGVAIIWLVLGIACLGYAIWICINASKR